MTLGGKVLKQCLIGVIKQLSDYNNIIVTLYPRNEFESNVKR